MKLKLDFRRKSNLISILFAYIEYNQEKIDKRENAVLHQRILEAEEILEWIKEGGIK